MTKRLWAVLLSGALLVHPAVAATALAQEAVEGTSLIADTVERVAPSVVNIAAETQVRRFARSPFEQFLFPGGPNNVVPRHGEGSGFVIDQKGLILTNDHVVSGATSITVNMPNGKKYKAHVKASDPSHDIAVLQLEEGFKPALTSQQVAKLGDSDKVRVGEWVIAIGSPFSLQKTVTKGIISALGRNMTIGQRQYLNLIQTDALINPGNSGGPLLNMKGEVIGVNSAINPNGQGIGFAIPINRAKAIATELITHGQYRGTWLGVNIEPVTEEMAERFGMGSDAGVVVRSVVRGGPAAKAGVRPGDLITQINSQPVTSPLELKIKIEATPAGQKAKLTLVRDGKPMQLDVTVDVMGKVDGEPGDDEDEPGSAPKASGRAQGAMAFWGLKARDFSPGDRQSLEVPEELTAGAVITQVAPGSRAEALGLEPEDVVFWVNRTQITGAGALEKALAVPANGRAEVLMKVLRHGSMLLLQASF